MEITVEQILEAIKKPEIINGLLPQLVEVEAVKKVIENRAEVSYKEKIGEEVKKIHSMYDADMFEILRVKPGQNSDGSAQKTYEKVKEIFTDYKKLSEMKDGLTKDAEVQRLKSELEKVKAEGGGKFIEEQFNKAKEEWTKKEQEFIKQIQDLGKQNTEGMIKTDLTSAFSSLKFNPDFSDTIKNTILATVESKILSSAKVENGKVIYYGADGKPMLNSTTFEPMTAAEVIASTKEIAEITLKEKPGGGGGGAPTTIKGSVKTQTVEGKDKKSLELPAGSFKSQSEFIGVAEKALLDSGVTRKDPSWNQLLNDAFNTYKVSELPTE